MIERFREFAAQHGLFAQRGKLIVGFSGGADSTCLLHLLAREQYDLIAAHLSHGQRESAEQDLQFCAEFANSLGVPFRFDRMSVPKIAAEKKIGIEEAGREARYAFFQRIAEQFEHAVIVTAHTADDLVETVFLNLARGAGAQGFTGIPVVRDNIVRPLLFARRSETAAYCKQHHLTYLSDECNDDTSFARVRARLQLVPSFESLHPGAFEHLLRTVNILRSENELLDSWARTLLISTRLCPSGPLGFLSYRAEQKYILGRMANVKLPYLRRMVRLVVKDFGADLDYNQTAAIIQAIQSSSRISITPQSSKCVVEIGARYMTVRNPAPIEPFDLPLDASKGLSHNGWRIEPFNAATGRFFLWAKFHVQTNTQLRARSYRNGDRMIPIGKNREVKLKELFDEKRIPRAIRRRIPVIADDDGPIWVPGVALAARSQDESHPENAVCLQFRPESTDSTV